MEIYLAFIFYAAVEIELDQISLSAPEGETVEVCAHLATGELEREVEVVLSSKSGTATG